MLTQLKKRPTIKATAPCEGMGFTSTLHTPRTIAEDDGTIMTVCQGCHKLLDYKDLSQPTTVYKQKIKVVQA